MAQEAHSQQAEVRREVLAQHMRDTQLVVLVCFLQESEVSFKSILAFPLLHLILHQADVCGQLERFTIAEPDGVVGLAFQQLDALCRQRGTEVFEDFFEEVREEQ
jgi:hypothetical protein